MSRFPTFLIASALGVGSAGCVFGPAALQVSHVGYNEVLRITADQQLLLNLVRLRYHEAPAFLEIGSVSAQFKFGQSADVVGTINEGPNPINPDRLGLSAGLTYEERPTITFTPLQGKDFVNELLSPLPLNAVVLLARSGWSIDRVLRITVQSMNGLDNASAASGPTPETAPDYQRFARVSRAFRDLQRKGLLEIGYETRTTDLSDPLPADGVTLPDVVNAVSQGYSLRAADHGDGMILTGTTRTLVWRVPPPERHALQVDEIVNLLDLAPGQSVYEINAAGAGGVNAQTDRGRRTRIDLQTRSLMGSLFYLSQSVEVSQRHRNMRVVTITRDDDGAAFDWSRVNGDLLRVRSGPTRPAGAAVAVRHRGMWFYVEDTDLTSKSTFAFLGQLFALQAGGAESVAPVLTLPVGG